MQETSLFLLYKLNEKAIKEKYCVNKSTKDLHCSGKCHLKKIIVKVENESRKNPFSVFSLKLKEVEIYFSPLNNIEEITSSFFCISSQHKFCNTCVLSEGVEFSLIKPPTVLG